MSKVKGGKRKSFVSCLPSLFNFIASPLYFELTIVPFMESGIQGKNDVSFLTSSSKSSKCSYLNNDNKNNQKLN